MPLSCNRAHLGHVLLIILASMSFSIDALLGSPQALDEIQGQSQQDVIPLGETNWTDCESALNTTELMINISQAAGSGRDSPYCICPGAQPCRSIKYAYERLMGVLSNITTHITFALVDEEYHMSDTAYLNTPAPNLETVTIRSLLPMTKIVAANASAVFWIGCNNTIVQPCISYSVLFENIVFTKFQSEYPSVLVLFKVNHVQITNCKFQNNNCSAVNSFDTSITIARTDFIQNHGTADFKNVEERSYASFPDSKISNGGALALIFCSSDNIVNITECKFDNNVAALDLSSEFISHTFNDTRFPRVGGGMVVLFMKNASKNNIFVSNTTFSKNLAFSGGAVAILAEGYASYNSLNFDTCIFDGNKGNLTSGAILYANWDYASDNQLILHSCTLRDNEAQYAGALKFLVSNTFKQDNWTPVHATNLIISNSTFCNNVAQTGSAMHLILGASVNRNPSNPVHIIDSKFCHHQTLAQKHPDRNEKGSVALYGGTILSNKIDMLFMGKNKIIKNKAGCAIFASNANIHIKGRVELSKNTAVSNGGAMSLADTSHLVMYPGSQLIFKDNYSAGSGGALAVLTVGMPELTYNYNPFCFLQYSVPNQPYSQWQTKIEFIGNMAEIKGGAIFINSLTACLWDEYPPHRSFHKALRWNSKFSYANNSVKAMYNNILVRGNQGDLFQADIATDTYKLVLGDSKTVKLAPGEDVYFQLAGYDELNSTIYSVPYASAMTKRANGTPISSHLRLTNRYFVLDPFKRDKSNPLQYEIASEYYNGISKDDKQNHEIQFVDTYSSFIASATMNITPVPCYPGFVFDKLAGSCVCNSANRVHGESFIEDCNGNDVTLRDGYWATSGKDGTSDIVATYCPLNYCKCTRNENASKKCIFNPKKLDCYQCNEGRTGVLCGRCKNASRGLSLFDGSCVRCGKDIVNKATVSIVIVVIGVIMVAILTVYLNPNFSTKMRGPVFYVQMLPYVFNANGSLGEMIRYSASIIALGGSSGLPIDFCLGPDWTKLHIIALTYVFAVAILLILTIVYILSRYYILNFTRDSPFESFWILLIATYCFFSETSLIFFYCVPINDKMVFFYDGSLQCYQGQHLYMIIASSVVLALFVLLPPFGVVLLCTGRIRAPQQIVDALTKGLRSKYRCWWAADLARRFAYVAVYVFIPQRGIKQIVFVIITNIVLTLHAFCQPYRNMMANIGETFLLLSMAIIATLQLNGTDHLAQSTSNAIFIANFTFMVCLFLFLLFHFIKKRLKKKCGFKILEDEQPITPYRSRTPARVGESPTTTLDNNVT